MGLFLPEAPSLPLGQTLRFAWARAYGDMVYLSGHAAQMPDGSFASTRGRVGAEVGFAEAQEASRLATLSMLGSLKRLIGDLDRVSAWLMVSGMVNVAPGFTNTTGVIDGCSDLLLELFGPEIGAHARTAVGVAQLPLNSVVVLAAHVALSRGFTQEPTGYNPEA
jgi:enamine deaminase RidA (YjgF/YER057c/UK114 family)